MIPVSKSVPSEYAVDAAKIACPKKPDMNQCRIEIIYLRADIMKAGLKRPERLIGVKKRRPECGRGGGY